MGKESALDVWCARLDEIGQQRGPLPWPHADLPSEQPTGPEEGGKVWAGK